MPRRCAVACVLALQVACGAVPHPSAAAPVFRGGVTLIGPRCAGARSCVLGHVVAAETSAPLSGAAVFFEREGGAVEAATSSAIVALTDEQGVFTVTDAPPGRYRLSVYKEARRVEVHGVEVAALGTTVIPVRLGPG
jgi:hypothetical protein